MAGDITQDNNTHKLAALNQSLTHAFPLWEVHPFILLSPFYGAPCPDAFDPRPRAPCNIDHQRYNACYCIVVAQSCLHATAALGARLPSTALRSARGHVLVHVSTRSSTNLTTIIQFPALYARPRNYCGRHNRCIFHLNPRLSLSRTRQQHHCNSQHLNPSKLST